MKSSNALYIRIVIFSQHLLCLQMSGCSCPDRAAKDLQLRKCDGLRTPESGIRTATRSVGLLPLLLFHHVPSERSGAQDHADERSVPRPTTKAIASSNA